MEKLDRITYREEIEQLFRKMPVMTVPHFIRSVNLITQYTGDHLTEVIRQYVRNGIVLISENSLVTTKFTVERVSRQTPKISRNGEIRVEAFAPKPFFSACMDCYPLILDLYPHSMGFRVSDNLFQISFTHEEKQLIYEIVRIPKNQDDMYRTWLLRDGRFYAGEEQETLRSSIRRIAMVESPACAGAVPYTGINLICMKDPESPRGFRILEKRTENTWRDIRETLDG